MKKTQSSKIMGIIALIALILGLAGIILAFISDDTDPEQKKYVFKISGLLLALAMVLFFLTWQIKRRKTSKNNHYHAVHWENGRITKED